VDASQRGPPCFGCSLGSNVAISHERSADSPQYTKMTSSNKLLLQGAPSAEQALLGHRRRERHFPCNSAKSDVQHGKIIRTRCAV
jgi:hypothetical protein